MEIKFMILSVLAVLLVIVILVIQWNIRRRKRRALIELEKEKERKELVIFLTNLFPETQKANWSFNEMLNFKNGFFNNYQLHLWKTKFLRLYQKIIAKAYYYIQLDSEIQKSIEEFQNYYDNSESFRNSYNESFEVHELKKCKEFLSNIEGYSLDEQQRKAIVCDEDNCLIVAGAGTGKTTTIAGKVKYLVSKKNINPSEILLISFTNKSCDVMKERIRSKMNINVEVKTFNKLGLDIIKDVENVDQRNVCDLSQKEFLDIINSFFSSLIENAEYQNLVVKYFTTYLKPYQDDNQFKSEGERIQYLKDQNLFGYKIIESRNSGGSTYTYRERLKSQEEVEIANFLFINNIEYKYEESYEYKEASKKFGQYKPDFYLSHYNIYIEHFAIDRNNNVPKWFKGDDNRSAREKYNAGIAWKRETHKKNNTILIETYSWERREGKLLSNLKSKLEDAGVYFNPMSDADIWDFLKSNVEDEISNFIRLIFTFLTLLKSNNLSIETITENVLKANNNEVKIRNQAFINIFQPIFHEYNSFLKDKHSIDFSDMLNIATTYISNHKFIPCYKYIIIDEFQDISIGRYNLIRAFLDRKPDIKLFCVGDDWQSIYRFTGSDIAIFTEFERYFEKSSIADYKRKTKTLYIETTYRFNDNLVKVTSDFITKNKKQLSKNLKSSKENHDVPISFFYYDFDSVSMPSIVVEAISDIMKKEENSATLNMKILLLGRYNHDINQLFNHSDFKSKYDKNENRHFISFVKEPSLNLEYLTVHSAKGYEADYVILVNLNSGKYGFPSEISDDPILNLLLTEADQFPNGEERRAFYVAMTRTKKHLYIIANKQIKSKFLIEIESDESRNILKCDWCALGILVEKSGKNGDYFSCSNFPYCNYTKPTFPKYYLDIAAEKFKDKEYESAISYYSKAIKSNPKLHKGYYGKAQSYEKLGRFDEAIKCYSNSIYLNKSHFESYYWRASSKYDIEDYDGAIRDWRSSITLYPDNESQYYWLGKAYQKLEKYNSAIKEFTQSIIRNPEDTESYIARGECFLKIKKHEDAIKDWEKAKALGSTEANTYIDKYYRS